MLSQKHQIVSQNISYNTNSFQVIRGIKSWQQHFVHTTSIHAIHHPGFCIYHPGFLFAILFYCVVTVPATYVTELIDFSAKV